MKKIISILILLLFISCKKEQQQTIPEIKPLPFLVTINRLGIIESISVNDTNFVITTKTTDIANVTGYTVTWDPKTDSIIPINVGDSLFEYIYSNLKNKYTNYRFY